MPIKRTNPKFIRGADGLTLRQRVWKWLHTNGPARGVVIGDALGEGRTRINDALLHLAKRGEIKGEGKSWRVWSVTSNVMPADLRGQMPASVHNLSLNPNRKKAHKMHTADGQRVRGKDFPRIATPVHALDICWGLAPTSRPVQALKKSETGSEYAGETTSSVCAEEPA